MHDTRPVIVGAGPAGAAAALFLAKAGIDCLLLDKATFPRDKICGDALSGKVVEVLRKLDPSLIEQFRQEQYQLGSWGIRFVAPNARELRVPFKLSYDTRTGTAPGFIAKRFDFDHFLVQQLLTNPRIEFRQGVGVEAAAQAGTAASLTLTDGTQLTTPLVLAADGAQSVLTKQLGGHKLLPRHHSAGLRQYWQGVQGLDHENFVELIFHKDCLPGYFWIFPLPGGQANVGIGMRTDQVASRKLNLRAKLAELISSAPGIAERFQWATPLEPPRGFGLPLGSKRISLSGSNYLLLGDAASLIDPFSGEGIGNALYSGYLAAQHIAAALPAGQFGGRANLAYDRAIYARLGSELRLGTIMQRLVERPGLFNLVVNKARRSQELRETIICMFDDMNLRGKLSNPLFYLRVLFA